MTVKQDSPAPQGSGCYNCRGTARNRPPLQMVPCASLAGFAPLTWPEGTRALRSCPAAPRKLCFFLRVILSHVSGGKDGRRTWGLFPVRSNSGHRLRHVQNLPQGLWKAAVFRSCKSQDQGKHPERVLTEKDLPRVSKYCTRERQRWFPIGEPQVRSHKGRCWELYSLILVLKLFPGVPFIEHNGNSAPGYPVT